MEEHVVKDWIYAVAALLLSVSLYAGNARNYSTLRTLIVRIIPYFFSLGPVALLLYSLFMVSHMY
jgi:hypothetical protein